MSNPPAPAHAGRHFRDLAISLVVLLIPLAAVVALFRLRGGEDTVVVDPSTAVAEARRESFPVAEPQGLSEQWRPISAAYQPKADGATLRIGYLTPAGGALQLVESTEPVDPLLIRELGDNTRPTGVMPAGSRSWDAYDVRGDEHALVAVENGRTLIVIGRADVAELEHLAAALG